MIKEFFNSWNVLHHIIKHWLCKHWCLDCILINYLLGFQQRILCQILRRAQVSSNFIDGFCTFSWMLMRCDVHATGCRTLSNSIGGLLIAPGLCLCWGAYCQCGWILLRLLACSTLSYYIVTSFISMLFWWMWAEICSVEGLTVIYVLFVRLLNPAKRFAHL